MKQCHVKYSNSTYCKCQLLKNDPNYPKMTLEQKKFIRKNSAINCENVTFHLHFGAKVEMRLLML